METAIAYPSDEHYQVDDVVEDVNEKDIRLSIWNVKPDLDRSGLLGDIEGGNGVDLISYHLRVIEKIPADTPVKYSVRVRGHKGSSDVYVPGVGLYRNLNGAVYFKSGWVL